MTNRPVTASDTFDAMSLDDRWQGFGYLGERRHAAPIQRAKADETVLRHAVNLGLDYEALFTWANSKDGRWYADCMFGSRPELAEQYLPRR